MKTNWFIVIEVGRSWWIDNEGKSFGPFSSREQAGSEALTIARMFADQTRQSQIFWPGDDGKQKLIWSGR